jgi:hypothetical protein
MATSEYHNGDGFYVRLEVAPTASHDEISRAYRRLAHSAHPDARPDDPDASRRFREITEAYEVLGNPARRARYDADQTGGRSVTGRPPSTRNPAEPSPAGAGTFRLAPTASPLSGRPGPHAPVFIGTGNRPAPSALFWAGPVHVEGPPQGAASALGQEDVASAAVRLLSELFAPWRWYR